MIEYTQLTLDLFDLPTESSPNQSPAPPPSDAGELISDQVADLATYDKILIAFSGGKDSIAAVLEVMDQLKEIGYSTHDISRTLELWHHEIDGREGSTLMDWPCTPGYCKAFAAAFDLPIYFSWRTGGFEAEMLKDGKPSNPVLYQTPEGKVLQAGGGGDPGRRMLFPQKSGDLRTRWCSGYLKIDVMSLALVNQPRFRGIRTLVVSGERGQESSGRSKYKQLEPYRADLRNGIKYQRHIDHWRPVLRWLESEVWATIERWKIRPHPCYYLGFSRCSCRRCIFGNADQWATLAQIDPGGIGEVAKYESRFGKTIDRKGRDVTEIAAGGTPYNQGTKADIQDAFSVKYQRKIVMKTWLAPGGMFGESCGPT